MLTHALLTALLLVNAPTSTVTPTASVVRADDSIPSSIFTTEKPKDAKEIKESKAAAVKGDIIKGATITLQGRIGGRKEPFVKGRAMFLLADSRLVACNEKPDDHCKFPWDFCCETPESLKANVLTIQIVGADGKPLKVDAQNVGGLKPLAKVTIVGTVAEATKEGTFVISATKIYVEKESKGS